MNTPLRYQAATYKDVPEQIRTLFEEIPETRRGIYIHGEVGTGKTHIAYGLAKKWIEPTILPDGREKRRTAMIWNTTELLRSIKQDFDLPANQRSYAEERVMSFEGLLFLDDVGSERMSEWVSETFYLIINKRYNRRLPIIITSNFSLADQAERIGDRTASRIAESCDVVELVGGDRRLNKVKKISIKV